MAVKSLRHPVSQNFFIENGIIIGSHQQIQFSFPAFLAFKSQIRHLFAISTSYVPPSLQHILQAGQIILCVRGFMVKCYCCFSFLQQEKYLSTPMKLECRGLHICLEIDFFSLCSLSCVGLALGNGGFFQFAESNTLSQQ